MMLRYMMLFPAILLMSACSSMHWENERDIQFSPASKNTLTTDYLLERRENNHENIVIADPGIDSLKFRRLEEFSKVYTKEVTLHDWTIIFEPTLDAAKMKNLIERNLAVLKTNYRGSQATEEGDVTVSTSGVAIAPLTQIINKSCNTSYVAGDLDARLTLVTRNNIPKEQLCNAYPVILGANGLEIVKTGNSLTIRPATEL